MSFLDGSVLSNIGMLLLSYKELNFVILCCWISETIIYQLCSKVDILLFLFFVCEEEQKQLYINYVVKLTYCSFFSWYMKKNENNIVWKKHSVLLCCAYN